MHGRTLPGIVDGRNLCLPEIGKQENYLDWRMITRASDKREEYKKDFPHVSDILEDAWEETVDWLESKWKELIQNQLKNYGGGGAGRERREFGQLLV